ncbi:hypothetical protein LSH36_678g01019 [Paralvinella palmiformis]|uniref:Uncharacterized protein n=1 Tax=Paralvinella palmiformis TaxID=53620 RepID=A0AAD9J2R3_9ANNE|nr:hypothetical protein LSH36_678g01019 [Paralvinella palmiformis]
MSKNHQVTEQSSFSGKIAKKRILSLDESNYASSPKTDAQHSESKENSPKSTELVSPAAEMKRSVKIARVRKVSMMSPNLDSPVMSVVRLAKKKIVKTPFKAAKMLGKNESPTGNTPHKAARVLGKLVRETNGWKTDKQLLTSTPVRSVRKRAAEGLPPLSDIGKRFHPDDKEESVLLEADPVTSGDATSLNGSVIDEASQTALNRIDSNVERGWWGWVCQIL